MISTRIFQWLFLIFGLSICISYSSAKDVRVVCYYTNWSVYRPGTAKFSPQNINPYLCTHLIYAFGGFTKENTLKPFDKYQDIEKGGYAKFTGLKTYNKDLKTLLAIGGWNEASSRFSPMVANADRRKQLVKNSIKFLRQNNFDGLDLDWEYPAFREGGKSRDKENYAKLVQELREEFERESEKTGRTRLLLTMAVPAGIEYVNKGYDIPKLTKYLDWMNILSYDYHSAFEPAVNHHAPLYPLREATEYDYDADLNIDYTIKHYLELGADPSKLVMGVPTYGRSYTLFNPDANAIGDPADGPGEMGEATRENGYLAYYEICENVKSNGWSVVQPNDKAMGPYAFKENQWVGFDDENIARKKAEYVAENGLGGIMFWAIDNDDFRGSCHGKPYPLIEAAKEALIAASGLTDDNLISPPSKPTKSKSRLRSRPRTTQEPTTEKTEVPIKSNNSRRRNRIKSKANGRSDSDAKSKSRRNEAKKAETTSTYSSLKVITPAYTTPEPPATPDQGGAFKCEDEGFFPHPKDCKKYFWCLSGPGESGIVAHQFTCPAGLYFNKAADSCDYSQNVLCNKKLSKTTSTTEGKKIVETTTQKISTKAPTTRTTARTTTTTEEEYEDEYEYEDEEISDSKSDSEEDPKVIKELLDLIKKAGGIEELEKQLNIGHDEVKEGATTPSTRTKSIVEKFLTSRTNKNTSGNNKYTVINRNSRGPQNAGIEKEANESINKKTDRKPQYTTISRKRPTQITEETDEDEAEVEQKEEKAISPKYTTIRRSKEGFNAEKRKTLDRNKILGEDDKETEDSNRREVTVHTTPQYVNIRRQRPSTTEQSSTSKYVSIRRSTTAESGREGETEEPTTSRSQVSESPITERTTSSLRYQTLNRQVITTVQTTSTTTTATPEPTTTTQASSTEKDVTTESPEIPSTLSSKSVDFTTPSSTAETEEPTSSPSSSISPETTSLSISTEEPKVETTKSPVLSEPRPFSVEKKSTISTTHKPLRTNIRSTASPSKNTRPAARFRIRTRPKSTQKPTSARATYSSNISTTSRSRTTKTTRRKYPHTTKIESQVTTPSAPIHSQYVSQTLGPRITTMMDQSLQPTNQQLLEKETTELSHIAFSLLQKAPLPSSVRPQQIYVPSTTPATIFSRVTSPRTRYVSSTLPIITNRFSIRRPQAPKLEKLKISEGFPQYDYDLESYLGQLPKYTKVILHSNGVVECLDQGNFPHPASCRKFISCAKMEKGKVLGWEYTCPKNLSFDPIGGICNWSVGLGCDSK